VPASTAWVAGPAAAKWHVHHLNAGAQLELLAGEVRFGPGPRGRVVESVRMRLRLGDQIGQRPDVGIAAHEQHIGGVDQLRDRREILGGVIRQGLEQGRVDGDRRRRDEERVAVGRRAGCDSHAAIAGGAAAIVDHDALSQSLRQGGGEDARDDVGRPARRERYDEGDRALRIGRVRATTIRHRCQQRHHEAKHGCRHAIHLSSLAPASQAA
jgi:hypothetical protein